MVEKNEETFGNTKKNIKQFVSTVALVISVTLTFFLLRRVIMLEWKIELLQNQVDKIERWQEDMMKFEKSRLNENTDDESLVRYRRNAPECVCPPGNWKKKFLLIYAYLCNTYKRW